MRKIAKVINTILTLKDGLSSGLLKAAKNTDKVSKEMVSATRSVVNFGKKADGAISKVTKKAVKLGAAAAGAAATGISALAVKAGVAADDLNTLSKQSGFSTGDIQKWKYASDLVDVSVDDIVAAAKKMKKNMVSTSSDVEDAWKKIGVSTTDSSGKLRDSTTVFYEALTGLSKIQNETQRDVLAMSLFGKSADNLAGIVDDGGESLRQLGQQAEDLGLILSQDALDSANKFNDQIDSMKARVSASFSKIGNTMAVKFLPLMERLSPIAEKFLNGVVVKLDRQIDALSRHFQRMADDGTLEALSFKLTDGIGKAADMAGNAFKFLQRHSAAVKGVLSGLGTAIAAIKILKFASEATSAAKTAVLFGKTLLALVGVGNPIGVTIAAIAALSTISGIVIANWSGVKAAAVSLWGTVKEVFGGIQDSVTGAFDHAQNAVSNFFGWIGNKLEWLDEKASKVPLLGSLYTTAKTGLFGLINQQGLGSSRGFGGNATGTSFFPGGWTRINERGGEIVNLPGGTQIIPHDVSRRMAGGMNLTIYLTVQGNVIGNRSYAESIGGIIAQKILSALRNTGG